MAKGLRIVKDFKGKTSGRPRKSKKNKYGLRKRGRKN